MSNTATLKLEAAITDNQITMCVYEDGSTLPHYDQTSVSLQEVFLLCDEIVKLLNKANSAVGKSSGISLELKKAGQCLYDQLLTESAKKKFRASKAVNLEVYIDEGLVAIPWELLFDGTQFLCLRFNMGRKVKTRQPSRSSGERISGLPIKMLILADPTNDLPMARQEAGVIEKQLDGMRKIIAVAKKVTNIDPIYVKKNLREYDIVHYAGHADHDPANPSQSGWKLSGGQLTAEDIARMGETAPLPALVFSNACRSAQTEEWVGGDFETQVFGLANAFLCAGVRHYIGTSWKIPDDTSLAFAKEFYAQLAQSKSVGEAIRLARLQIIKEQGEDSIVWASYVLYGDPTAILFGIRIRLFDSKVLLKKKTLVILGLVGLVISFAWIGRPFFEGWVGGDSKALLNYYFQEGWKYKNAKNFVEAEKLLKKSLIICNKVTDCNQVLITDEMNEVAALKALIEATRKQDSEMCIRTTMDLGRVKMEKYSHLGQTADGVLVEGYRNDAIETYKSAVSLIEAETDISASHKDILADASFSLVMLYIPGDLDRAEVYLKRLLSYVKGDVRLKYTNQISAKIGNYLNAGTPQGVQDALKGFKSKMISETIEDIKPAIDIALRTMKNYKAAGFKEWQELKDVRTGNADTDIQKRKAYYQAQIDTLIKKGDLREVAFAYLEYAKVFVGQGLVNEAKDYADKAKDLGEKNGFNLVLVSAYSMLAEVYLQKKDWASFLVYHKKYVAVEEKINPGRLRLSYLFFGGKLLEASNLSLAREFFVEAERLWKNVNAFVEKKELGFIYDSLWKICETEERWEDGFRYLREREAIASANNDMKTLKLVLFFQIQPLAKMRKNVEQLDVLKRLRAVADSQGDNELVTNCDGWISKLEEYLTVK